MTSTRHKVLVPLATMLAAGAVAVGSGATFSSETGNTISAVTSGTLTHSNSKDGKAIFALQNVKPGDVVNGSLTVTNTGSLPARFALTEVSSANAFSAKAGSTASNLSMAITNVTTNTQVYNGDFGGLVDGAANDLGVIAPGVPNEYRFTVKLDADTPNGDQAKSASAVYRWNSVQLSAETTNQ